MDKIPHRKGSDTATKIKYHYICTTTTEKYQKMTISFESKIHTKG